MPLHRIHERMVSDPVVAAAMAAHGVDAADLPWEPCEEAAGDEVSRRRKGAAPDLHLHSDGSARLRWWSERSVAAYTLSTEGHRIATLEGVELPETVLQAMTGRTLDAAVDMPGAERLRVVTAVNSRAFASDPYDVRILVEPVE